MPANFNVSKKPRSYTIHRERAKARLARNQRKAGVKVATETITFSLSKNALTAVTDKTPGLIANSHQLAAVKSNPRANFDLSKKKMKKMRKRIVFADASTGDLVPVFCKSGVEAMTE